MGANALKEILALFEVKVDKTELSSLNNTIKETMGALGGLAASFGIAFGGKEIKEFVQDQIDAARKLTFTAEKAGSTVAQIRELYYATEVTGGSVEDMGRAMVFLHKSMGQAENGNKASVEAFRQLGISVADIKTQDPHEILMRTADGLSKIKDVGRRTQIEIATFGRGVAKVIPVIQMGRAGIEELGEEFHKLGGDAAAPAVKRLSDAQKETKRLGAVMKNVKFVLADAVLPTFMKFVDVLKQYGLKVLWYAENTYVLRTAFLALSAVAGGVLLFNLIKIAKALAFINPNKPFSIKSLLSFGWQAAVVVGIVMLLYAAFDDVYTMMKGGDSVLGEFLEKIGGVAGKEAFIQAITEAVGHLQMTFAQLMPSLKEFGGIIVEVLPYAIFSVVTVFREWALAIEMVINHFIALRKILSLDFKGAIETEARTAKDAVKFMSDTKNTLSMMIAAASQTKEQKAKVNTEMGGAQKLDLPDHNWYSMGQARNAKQNPAPVNVQVTNHINGAGDPGAVAQRIAAASQNAFDTAAAEHAAGSFGD